MARRPAPCGLSGWPFIDCSRPATQLPFSSWKQRDAAYQPSECGTVIHGLACPSTVYAPLDISRYMLCMVRPARLMPGLPSGPLRSLRTRSVMPFLL